ncbi:hypothetical protein, partial [Bacteroides sp.]|uniref:hypothetical protein n=1 Tax=Bacteroides sp. TaxID=29523 RepID=UPI0026271F92
KRLVSEKDKVKLENKIKTINANKIDYLRIDFFNDDNKKRGFEKSSAKYYAFFSSKQWCDIINKKLSSIYGIDEMEKKAKEDLQFCDKLNQLYLSSKDSIEAMKKPKIEKEMNGLKKSGPNLFFNIKKIKNMEEKKNKAIEKNEAIKKDMNMSNESAKDCSLLENEILKIESEIIELKKLGLVFVKKSNGKTIGETVEKTVEDIFEKTVEEFSNYSKGKLDDEYIKYLETIKEQIIQYLEKRQVEKNEAAKKYLFQLYYDHWAASTDWKMGAPGISKPFANVVIEVSKQINKNEKTPLEKKHSLRKK